MEKFFKRFVSEDKGTVTADWVVLVAGVIMLCGAVISSLGTGATDLADDTATYVETYDPLT